MEDNQLHTSLYTLMAEGISTLLIIRRWCVFATTTIPSLVRLSKSSGGYGGRPRRV
jgi:hypothetical protein